MKEAAEVVRPQGKLTPYIVNTLLKKNGTYYVAVSHLELDSLIGRLMQLAELTGDKEQREALKQELKHRSRDWLNDIYTGAGYDQWQGAREEVTVIEV